MDMTLAISLIALAFGAGYGLGRKTSTEPHASHAPPAPPDPAALAAVRPILASQGKIAAIKAYREQTGTGLREAKLAVDTLDG